MIGTDLYVMVRVSGSLRSSSEAIGTEARGTRSLYESVVFAPSKVAFDTHSYLRRTPRC